MYFLNLGVKESRHALRKIKLTSLHFTPLFTEELDPNVFIGNFLESEGDSRRFGSRAEVEVSQLVLWHGDSTDIKMVVDARCRGTGNDACATTPRRITSLEIRTSLDKLVGKIIIGYEW